jgi:hypothetical protein
MKSSLTGVEQVLEKLRGVAFQTMKNVVEASEITAAEMENTSKDNRPWTDRTGDARRSIYAFSELDSQSLVIYHGIRVDYGVYLELSNAGKYRVIGPTVESYRSIWLNRLSKTLEAK